MRGSRVTVIALAAAGSLALTGCGDDGDGAKGKASPAAQSPPATTSAPAATTAPAAPLQGDNGVAAKPPREVVQAAQEALSSANSVRVVGTFVEDGKPIALDLRLGQDLASGSITGPAKTGNATVQLRSVDGKVYLQAGPEFWRDAGGQAAVTAFAGRWVIVPAGTIGQGVQNFVGIRQFAKVFSEVDGQLTSTGPTTIDGRPATGIRSSDSYGYFATTGKPYPLRLTPLQGGDTQRLDFTDYDAPLSVSAPPEAIDASKIRPS